MTITCRSCGAILPEGTDRCPSCFAPVKPPGFFQRLLGGLKDSVQIKVSTAPSPKPGIHFNIKTTVKQTYKVRDSVTGEMKEYHSLDEVPPEYREQLKQVLGKAFHDKTGQSH